MNDNNAFEVVHEYGVTRLTSQPSRIVTISTGQTDAAVSLGVVPVGTTRGHGTGIYESYLSLNYVNLARRLGSMIDLGERKDPNINLINSVKPDLILLNAAGLQKHETYVQLNEIAPTVVTKGKGTNWRADFITLALALGRSREADSWLRHYDQDCQKHSVEGTKVAFIRANGSRIKIMGHNSFAGMIAKDSGLITQGAMAGDSVSCEINADDINNIDAEWVFYGGQFGGAETIRATPEWKNVPAVRAGKAIEVPFQPFFNNAGPTAARIVQNLLGAVIEGRQ